MKKRTYDDDDGRRIADMSDVGAPSSLFSFRIPPERRPKKQTQEASENSQKKANAADGFSLNREERSAAVGGALAAALLIALVFIVGLGLAIFLMLWFWR